MSLFAATASELPGSADTEKALGWIEQTRAKLTPADWRAARSLNADGDKAYRRGQYSKAFTAYVNSYPNAPNAYAYVMAGDSNWRAAVHEQRREAGASCRQDYGHFPHYLALDVAQHQAVAVALAEHDHDQAFLKSPLYQRAREQTACLQEMARDYEQKPPSACVDLDRLARCLGPPLIK